MNKKYKVLMMICTLVSILLVQQLFSTNKVLANVDRVEDLMKNSKVQSQEEIAQSLIRFHVLANSDSDSDQEVKAVVRDEVLKEIVPYLEKSQSLEETRNIIENNKDKMIEVATEVLKENGKDYGATAALGKFSFPTKYYGQFSLPAGTYEAFRIVLGEGKGANWWCVMFPPLCFIHVEDTASNTESVEEMIEPAAHGLEEEDEEEESIEKEPEVEVRWKIVEIFQSLFK
ncbi:stage II sporulation protein R [Irregularibacter muris]|uniref:Stage II sporulation protein R n=1 Tax=Irregularibacter muris TaxID=1796619 RepID=A0AAE3HG14_9FIRM|nr:stage II sporulation protein R [Irregularibacter muris]MCR1899486.1 stage II sporulation protein R [Irregularibacter muris]